jgi:hypothetical protein
MIKRGQFEWVMVLIAGLCPLMLRAQDQVRFRSDEGAGSRQTQTTDTGTVSGQASQETQYVGSLNGSGLIAMGDRAEHMLLSLTSSGGWDSNPGNATKSSGSGVYTVSPYLGYKATSPRSQYIAQYHPTITGYMSNGYARQTLHLASGSLILTESNRLKWELNAYGSYGPNGTRLLSSPQTVVLGDVPVTSAASSASYLNDSGNVTYLNGSLSATYRSSERNTIAVTGSNAYSRTSALNQEGGIANLRGTFARDISESFGLNSYVQAGHYYGDLQAESYGLGAGFSWHPRERASVSFNAGPQFNTCTCGGTQIGLAYTASFSSRLTNKSQMYFLADHQPTVSYLGPSLWQRSASGGFQYRVTPIGFIGADIGYVSSDTLTAASSYRGTSWGANYSFRLRHGLGITYSYRGYATNTSGVDTRRNLVQASIMWTYRAGQSYLTGY